MRIPIDEGSDSLAFVRSIGSHKLHDTQFLVKKTGWSSIGSSLHAGQRGRGLRIGSAQFHPHWNRSLCSEGNCPCDLAIHKLQIQREGTAAYLVVPPQPDRVRTLVVMSAAHNDFLNSEFLIEKLLRVRDSVVAGILVIAD